MIVRRTFPQTRSSVPEARHFTAEVLEGMPAEFVDAVTLMVSELATNAILHGESLFEIVIDCESDEVLVDVSDHGGGEATPKHPSNTDLSGRGLQIVNALADTWGVRAPIAGWEKTVWFRVRVPQEEPARGR